MKRALQKPTAKLLTDRRKRLEKSIEYISSGEPLASSERRLILLILKALRKGYDVRTDLGIPPKSGPRPRMRVIYGWLSCHYWTLRIHDGEKDLTARQLVAECWGFSPSYVWKIAQSNSFGRGLAQQVVDGVRFTPEMVAHLYRNPD